MKDEKKKAGTSRTFLSSWKINRDWLRYEGGLMFCSVCREVEGEKSTNSFVRGTSNLNLENVKNHEKAKCHRAASLTVTNRKKRIQETLARITLLSLTTALTDRVKLYLL